MKKLLVTFATTLALTSSFAFANSNVELIEKNVDSRFQPTALSLIANAKIKKVELVNGRVVVTLDTKDKYFDIEVLNGRDSFTAKKSLGTVKIPFPNKDGDLVEQCYETALCPSKAYRDAYESYGLTRGASDIIFPDEMDFYFMTVKHRSLFTASQDIHIGLKISPTGNSFDEKNSDGFFYNGCDRSACWGSYGISLKLMQK